MYGEQKNLYAIAVNQSKDYLKLKASLQYKMRFWDQRKT